MKIIKILTAVISFCVVFLFLQKLLMPKWLDIPEGNLIREYYNSSKDHDIIFIGDCEVFSTFSPVVLWEEFGITSFVRGSAQQLIWQSYYLLRETLTYERPKVIVLAILAMQYGEPQAEAYNRLTLDGMRMSRHWFNSLRASMVSGEDIFSYFLPFFRYKDRWNEINANDFAFIFNRPQVSLNGFLINANTAPWSGFSPTPLPRATYEFGQMAVDYLNKITDLAYEYDIPLVLIKAPTIFPTWHDAWNEQIVLHAERNNLLYVNLLEHDMGLDFTLHTFDAGYTLNVFGAELVTRFFGEILVNEFNLASRKHEPGDWQRKSEIYHRTIEIQLYELETYGHINTVLAN